MMYLMKLKTFEEDDDLYKYEYTDLTYLDRLQFWYQYIIFFLFYTLLFVTRFLPTGCTYTSLSI